MEDMAETTPLTPEDAYREHRKHTRPTPLTPEDAYREYRKHTRPYRRMVAMEDETETTPLTPEDAYREYRKRTRPYRRMFRGIITRKEAERFVISRARKQQAVIQSVEGKEA